METFLIPRRYEVVDVYQDRLSAIYRSLRWLRHPFDHKDEAKTVRGRDTTEDGAMNLLVSLLMPMRLTQPSVKGFTRDDFDLH